MIEQQEARELSGRAIRAAQAGEMISSSTMRQVVSQALTGVGSAEALGQLLYATGKRGETVDELDGFIWALRDHTLSINLPGSFIDVCGTGGSGRRRFNVSTASAFVLAAGGALVAKQMSGGSRGNGSADFLRALGLQQALPAEAIRRVASTVGLCFINASEVHPQAWRLAPALRRAAGAPHSLIRYSFPLCSPVALAYQVVGTSSAESMGKLAELLTRLGRRRGLALRSACGLDELSVWGSSDIVGHFSGRAKRMRIMPCDLGIPQVEPEDIPCGDPSDNARHFRQLIRTGEPRQLLDFVCINSGVALWCCGRAPSLFDGYSMSKQLFQNGRVREKFNQYIDATSCNTDA